MARKKWKDKPKISFSSSQKAKYYDDRCNDESLSKRKRAYAESWLDGFRDKYPKRNINSCKSQKNDWKNQMKNETDNEKKRICRENYIHFCAKEKGLKARIDSDRLEGQPCGVD